MNMIDPQANGYLPIPTVIEKSDRGETGYGLFSKLLKENIIFLGTPIDSMVANMICGQLLHLESENPDRDINVYINSPGGDISAMFAIYDTMTYIKPDINTICFGQAASAAAVLLGAGTKGKRMALPHARILLHQPYAGAQGQVSDLEIASAEIQRMKKALEETRIPQGRSKRSIDAQAILRNSPPVVVPSPSLSHWDGAHLHLVDGPRFRR